MGFRSAVSLQKTTCVTIMSIDEIFADVLKEGDTDPFKDLEKETLPESQPDKKPEEDKPVAGDKQLETEINTPKEEDMPFHKHPRWIERDNELKDLKSRTEEYEREIQELKSFKEESTKSDKKVPEWFSELYGDNEVAWRKYEQREKERDGEIEKRAIARITQEQQKAQEETNKWNNWVTGQIKQLEDSGEKFDKNELNKIMVDYQPTTNNNLDFHKGLEILKLKKASESSPEKSQARKQIADVTSKTNSAEQKKKDFMTTADLRYKSWSNL